MADLPSVIGRYEIISRLGQGGMGSLFLAKDPKIGRLVAIKLVRQEFDSPEARQRFAREAQSAGTLRHPNIVTIFDVDEHDGLPYIAMEYVDGETLSEIVRRKAPYTVAKRLQWIEELCAGLAYAHRQGVVHRDIKPANLMLDNEGALKILDFGLARKDASKFTQSQTIIGTPNYMSPEQIRAGDVGPKSDIFAVGAVMYELVAYAEAFPGSVHQAMHKILYEEPTPLDEVMPNIDRGITMIVARALDKDPERRYQDLTLMRAAIATVRQRLEQQIDESAQTIVTPQPSSLRSNPALRPPAGTTPGSVPGSGGARRTGSRVGGTARVTLQKRRAAQIEAHLVEARKLFESGDFTKARESVEQALMFDTEHPTGLQLMEEITAEEERRQIAAFVDSARAELRQGKVEAAERIVAQALEYAPQSSEIQQLREAIDTTRREIERARQVQETLRRARARFSEGSFEGALRAVGELLAIDPGNPAALDLQLRAQEAIESRDKRVERDAAAQAAVAEARALYEKGDKASAIAKLEAYSPRHDLVSGFLASLRGEFVEEPAPLPEPPPPPEAAPIQTEPAAPSAAPAGGVALSAPPPVAGKPPKTDRLDRSAGGSATVSPEIHEPATAAFMPGRSQAGPGHAVGTGSRAPIYAGVAFAVLALVAAGIYFSQQTRDTSTGGALVPPGTDPAINSSASAPAAAAPAPVPTPPIPPPAVVTPPAALTDEPLKTDNDRDAMAAYKLLGVGNHVEASKLVAEIAKRDPKNANLRDLRAAIQKVQDNEKERAAATAAAAAAAANPPPPVPGSSTTPTNPSATAAPPAAAPPTPTPAAPPPVVEAPKPAASEPIIAALPGGGFVTKSEPPSPGLIGEIERPAIEQSIQEYAKALSTKDISAISKVRKYTADEANNWQKIFKQFAEYRLIVKVLADPVVTGDKATILVEEQAAQTAKKGGIQVFGNVRKLEYKLEKVGGKWMLLPPG